jgi:hypothetical protein
MCRKAIERECLLQADAEADKEIVRMIHGGDRYGIPSDEAHEIRMRYRKLALERARSRGPSDQQAL